MRYVPYVGVVVIITLVWAFSPTHAQVRVDTSGSAMHGTPEAQQGTRTASPLDSTAVRAMVAEAAGYPRIGSDVEIGLNPSAAIPAPFDKVSRKARGKLLAFDANWVGIQAREYDVKVWLPRENVGYVASIPGNGEH
jgi:hypothetical protein